MNTMKLGYKTRNVFSDDGGRLPGAISRTIALPINKIVELVAEIAGIQEGVDNVVWGEGRVVVDEHRV